MNEDIEKENKILKEEIATYKNNYKKLSLELGQAVFQNEEYENKIRQLEKEIETLKQENNTLKQENQQLIKDSKWNLKSIIKK